MARVEAEAEAFGYIADINIQVAGAGYGLYIRPVSLHGNDFQEATFRCSNETDRTLMCADRCK